ncbi:carboxypeptidase-like regulatory domain-containing protein [Neolewinella antarctica]|uniref:Carboxypeptidase-like regulatory domain-containing protein n=1 Tax=Neolewinella antarctica TaxID=442734 RepID=A0ABX0XGF8_9BACT|nr:carboxypeptidase-like regulatory domain-containing protein [Neolewinella antarctica]NJC27966.1 hypothetical protein [Neolewinella antarctica]
MRLLTSIFLLLSLCCSGSATAQGTLSGTVRDSLTNEPIPFATVYIDGTTIGTVTEESGTFSLDVSLIPLPTTLAVTHLGYRRYSARVDSGGSNYGISLSPQVATTVQVEVTDDGQWAKNVKEFKRRFLGVDDWGLQSKLIGEDRLYFERNFETQRLSRVSKQTARLLKQKDLRDAAWKSNDEVDFNYAVDFLVRSTAPIQIDLPHLGYKVGIDLQQFYLHYETTLRSYQGRFFFQPYEGVSGKPKRRHRRNREIAYYNSRQHFLRAAYNDALAEEGYVVLTRNEDESIDTIDFSYYLRQVGDDEKAVVGLEGCSLTIFYYATTTGRPIKPGRRRYGVRPIVSTVQIEDTEAVVRRDGTTGAVSLIFGGTMARRGAAWLFPANYSPSE